ncbi:MAG: hypothetical protein K5849_05715, partial [Bacteroidales bacterium]|nr:hypothetical protein [Bacteroidales bacterium]
MKHPLLLLLLSLSLCGCSALSRVNWDYNHLASAGGKALTAASLTDDQIAELCRQSVAYTDSLTPMADARYQRRIQKLMAGVKEIEGRPLNFKVYKSD